MIRLYVQQIPGANGENVTVSHSRSQAKGLSLRKARQKKRDDSSPKLHIIRLPVELRGVVFRQDLLEWTEGRLTPNLIKALQPNLRLYSTTQRWTSFIPSKLIQFHQETCVNCYRYHNLFSPGCFLPIYHRPVECVLSYTIFLIISDIVLLSITCQDCQGIFRPGSCGRAPLSSTFCRLKTSVVSF